MEMQERYETLHRAAVVTVWVNAALAIAKLLAGILSQSTAVLSDGVHTLSDVLSTFLVMLGLKFSNRAADRDHPYGHQRVESVVSLFLSFALAGVALGLGVSSVRSVLAGNTGVPPSHLALWVTAISILVKEWMFRYTRNVAQACNSSSLLSDAWHHRSDAISSIAVLIGVGGRFFGLWILEPIATLLVCVLVFRVAWDIGRAAVNQLIDHSADTEITEKIQDLALSVDGVHTIDLLRTRISNNIIFVELEVSADAALSLLESHEIAHHIHDLVEAQSGMPVGHCMVHVNPAQ